MASCVLACQSTTAVDPLACESVSSESMTWPVSRGDHNLADSVYRHMQLLVASFVININY